MRLNQRPFRVGHVACITQIFSPILPPSGFSPHVVSPVPSDTPRVSQLAEITKFILSQPLIRNRSATESGGISNPPQRQAYAGGYRGGGPPARPGQAAADKPLEEDQAARRGRGPGCARGCGRVCAV